MILKPVLRGASAAGAVAAAAGVVVVAVAFALYALFKYLFAFTGDLAPAIASALVALIVAAAAGIGATIALGKAKGPAAPKTLKPGVEPEPRTGLERAMELARERPIVAAVGALAAGLIALRNPALITAAIAAFSAPPRPPRS